MIDRRDMLKLVAVGVVGAVVAGAGLTNQVVAPVAGEQMRFSVEGDMGAIRATVNGETFRVSGNFVERALFTVG